MKRVISILNLIKMSNILEDGKTKIPPEWTMSEERGFIETLTNQRLNFFLLIFSIVIAGAINSKIQLFFKTILICGTILCSLLAWTIFRSNKKLGKILKHIKKDQTHPISIIDEQIKGISVRWIIGIAIPMGCSLFLSVATALALKGTIKVTEDKKSPNEINTIQINKSKKIIDSIKTGITRIRIQLDSLETNIQK